MVRVTTLGVFTTLFISSVMSQNTWCSNHSTWLICDPSADINARAADIVSRISLADKIQALGTSTPGLPSVGLPAYNWWSEATHGISHVTFNSETPYASNTALPITTSCSFNRSLWHATGNQIGREARAFMNVDHAYSTYWAPVINIVRDPRWGRNIESAGEDPYASGQYAVNYVQGLEHAKETPYPLQASACCKHYIANELDGWNGTDRNHIDVYVPQQDLADSYMPSFQACVEDGQVSGIMCSYNAVNGVPSCANDWLLQTVLRDTWQFDGYVTSDCDADSDVYYSHHYTNTIQEAVADVLHAGTDVDCGSFVPQNAQSALNSGDITESDIDTVLTRLFKVRIRLGHFDPPGALQTIGLDQICNPYAIELARDGARQGMVLQKNLNNVLPLTASKYQNAVVIGPNIKLTDTVQYYGGEPCNHSYATAVDAITAFISSTTSILGVPDVGSNNTDGIPQAVQMASQADVVFLAIGSDLMLEREGHDRLTIDFSDGQKALISAVAAAAKGPVIAIVFSGGAMDVTCLLSNSQVDAVIHVGQPSTQIVAVGDIIFGQTLDGRKVSPAGRMSQMTYPADYVNQVSMFDFGMRPGPSAWPPGTNPGRTYRFYTGTPVLPYGFGLSYTTFTYTPIPGPTPPANTVNVFPGAVVPSSITKAIKADLAKPQIVGHMSSVLKQMDANYWVNVTNTGTVDSDDVVLGFLVPPGAGQNGVPLQELFGFERVFVPAGQTVTVYLGGQNVRFTQTTESGERVFWPGEYTVRFGVRETAQYGMGFAEYKFTVE